ncbi:short chain dehydrogenase reductase family [Colletotrichum plurivorum]|uniref:Short chain dehydrogenase reductase family n=1 Tax=Colletotrichum plurivorum TaxID=2175906 RepID=A0A8H6JN57_9PEZI|nr:short chain dehydrogenase reductase family [Colletotrichum plurivorum]
MSNTAAPEFREAKQTEGTRHVPTGKLFRLDERTIVITGRAGYLGLEAAGCILESGADVICLDVVETPRPEVWTKLEEFAKKYGQEIFYHRLDVTDSQATSKTFETFVPSLRHPIRGMVGCAGVSDNDPAHEFSAERFRRVVDINLTGTFAVAQAVALEMQRANVDGSMVFTASMSGSVANKGVDTAAYNASKSGVLQLGRSLAAEWGSRKGMPLIRVNTLSPGYIRTPATEEALQKPGMEEQWKGDNMLYHLSRVDGFRGPILFLLSDASSFMTGADLRVNGGHCAW